MSSSIYDSVLLSIEANPVGDKRYPVGTEAKVYSSDGILVAKVEGDVVASFPKRFEKQIRNEKEKRIELGPRVGDTIVINVMVPSSRVTSTSDSAAQDVSEFKKEVLYRSGLALSEYDDETLKQLVDVDLAGMYKSMPGAWTGLALTLTGDHGSNEIVNTLKVLIRQNTILMKQNEMMLRELRKINSDARP